MNKLRGDEQIEEAKAVLEQLCRAIDKWRVYDWLLLKEPDVALTLRVETADRVQQSCRVLIGAVGAMTEMLVSSRNGEKSTDEANGGGESAADDAPPVLSVPKEIQHPGSELDDSAGANRPDSSKLVA